MTGTRLNLTETGLDVNMTFDLIRVDGKAITLICSWEWSSFSISVYYREVSNIVKHYSKKSYNKYIECKTNTMVLKNRVKEFTESRGITIYKFVQQTGIAMSTGYKLSQNPNHLPSITVLQAICDRYEIQPNEIVYWID
jgi:DNA-binding Xre family transcriptional regulator